MTLENDLNSSVSWARTVQNENGIPAARKEKTDRMALCSGPDEVSKKKKKKKKTQTLESNFLSLNLTSPLDG